MADIQVNDVLLNELGDNAMFIKTNVADHSFQAGIFSKA
jgi:hypothetical protein